MRRPRPVPRPFTFSFGGGQIVEEASFRGAHHEPCIQLLKFADGLELLRLCSYTLAGRYERDAWLAGPEELAGLSQALEHAPRCRELLARLLAPSWSPRELPVHP